jgi:ribosomal protein S18 acetylase RimI-like enzyme
VWRDDERGAELVGMWVAPAERGSGVAHRLIDTLRGLVPSDCPLELEVQPDNARAIRFYERYGFKRIGDPAIGVSEGTLLRMRLG